MVIDQKKIFLQQQIIAALQNDLYYFDTDLWKKSSWLAWRFMKTEKISYTEKKHNLFTNTIGYALNVKINIEENNFDDFKKFYDELSEPSKKKFNEINEFDFFTKKRAVKEEKK